jgi:hypothetical protein
MKTSRKLNVNFLQEVCSMEKTSVSNIALRYLSSLHGTSVQDEKVILKNVNQTAIIHMCGDHIVINLKNELPKEEFGTIALQANNLQENIECLQSLHDQILPEAQ